MAEPETIPQINPDAIRERLAEDLDFAAELGAFAGRAYMLGQRYYAGEIVRGYVTPEHGISLATRKAAHVTKQLLSIAATGWDARDYNKLDPPAVAKLIDGLDAEREAAGLNVDPNLRVLKSEAALFGYQTPDESMHRFGEQ